MEGKLISSGNSSTFPDAKETNIMGRNEVDSMISCDTVIKLTIGKHESGTREFAIDSVRRIKMKRLLNRKNNICYLRLANLSILYSQYDSFLQDTDLETYDLDNWNVITTYIDSDGDRITFSSDEEFIDALNHLISGENIIRICVEVKKNTPQKLELKHLKSFVSSAETKKTGTCPLKMEFPNELFAELIDAVTRMDTRKGNYTDIFNKGTCPLKMEFPNELFAELIDAATRMDTKKGNHTDIFNKEEAGGFSAASAAAAAKKDKNTKNPESLKFEAKAQKNFAVVGCSSSADAIASKKKEIIREINDLKIIECNAKSNNPFTGRGIAAAAAAAAAKKRKNSENAGISGSVALEKGIDIDKEEVKLVKGIDYDLSPLSSNIWSRWGVEILMLRDLGFENDHKSVEALESLQAANIGVDSSDLVTVEQAADLLLKT